jgi:hypothetical protein
MNQEKQKEQKEIPKEFEKIIVDFIGDIQNTFPEYNVFLLKWWKSPVFFDYITDESERAIAINKSRKNSIRFLFNFILKKYPPHFFDILYQNTDIFSEDSTVDTEFLPQIHFKNLWQCDIGETTRATIWKYLQLILFSVVGRTESPEAFGDTSKLFERVNEEELKTKLEEILAESQKIFEQNGKESEGFSNLQENGMPNAEDIHSHISGMLKGKLGQLAKEIAEETAADLNMNMENETDIKGVFQKMMQNPAKMMGIVKNIGSKLEDKMKSGEIKESELMSEATEMLQKMKNMPGMQGVQEMLGKMGLGGRNSKIDLNAMETQLNRNMKNAKMKERMRKNVEIKKQQDIEKKTKITTQFAPSVLSDDEIINFINDDIQTIKQCEKKMDSKKSDKKHKKK